MLEHGGRLREAAARWGIPLADWLDLSTGIAPWSYPGRISERAWQRLPEDDDGLEAAAGTYYGHPAPLPLPGSQAAIQMLPRLIPPCHAVLPLVPALAVMVAPTYGEYAPAWRAAGHRVEEVASDDLERAASAAGVVMLANPNNPSGECLARDRLHALALDCGRRGAWMIIDEAFADAGNEQSLAELAGTELPHLIVLRSLGKFFGLAGARVGFLCAAPQIHQRLAAALGPWAVAHPSRLVATQALADTAWQAAQRQRLAAASARLRELLARHGLGSNVGGQLFLHAVTPRAAALHEHLAHRAILVRLFAQPAALRFGLPGGDAEWLRLERALTDWSST